MVAAHLNNCLAASGGSAVQMESWDLGVLTTSDFGEASVVDECWPTIKKGLDKMPNGQVAVITGFIGKDDEGRITTLGRGGSDLTASLLGAAAGYDEVQVWKDVDGILTADPRVCPEAKPVPEVSFDEAAELAYFGAQVLHPVAMQPAMKTGTNVRVKNSYNRKAPGTLISATQRPDAPLVSAITSKAGVVLVDITSTRMLGAYGFLARVFNCFDKNKLSIDVIASSEVSVSLTLNKRLEVKRKERDAGGLVQDPAKQARDPSGSTVLDAVVEELSEVASVELTSGHAIITLIANVGKSSQVLSSVFGVMAALGIPVTMLSQARATATTPFRPRAPRRAPASDPTCLPGTLFAGSVEGEHLDGRARGARDRGDQGAAQVLLRGRVQRAGGGRARRQRCVSNFYFAPFLPTHLRIHSPAINAPRPALASPSRARAQPPNWTPAASPLAPTDGPAALPGIARNSTVGGSATGAAPTTCAFAGAAGHEPPSHVVQHG